MSQVEIVQADLNRKEHQQAVVELIDAYAADSMGNGKPLPDEIKRALIPGLQKHPTTIIFLAYMAGRAVGIAVCFQGFSTFAARPLINIHDLAVLPGYRGQGIGKLLLQEIERKAKDMGFCKLTLEVQENNLRARRIYETAGFGQARYQNAAGGSLFYTKQL